MNRDEREIRKEAKELMDKLTLDEKIGMIHGAELFRTAPVERLGIPALTMSDGPMGGSAGIRAGKLEECREP